jgi:alkane 1-monooxygenase
MRNAPWAAVPFLAGFPLAPIVMMCVTEGGWWTFAPVLVVFVGVPILDVIGGMAESARVSPDVDVNPWFKAVTWAWVPVQLGLVAWIIAMTTRGGLEPYEQVGAALSMGVTAGAIGITFAHELVHRSRPFERALGEILLASVSYTHFAIEHVHGHHRQVGTPHDPATARLGESFYRFLPRTLVGSVCSAWRLEVERLARRGRGAFSPGNRMLRYALTQAVIYGVVWRVYGAAGVAIFAGQAVVAFSLLEVINYIEHYGLARRQLASGKYERVLPQHSWNSAHRVSNIYLFNLARHSDHHYLASREYDRLRHYDDVPQLPTGYVGMVLLALFPPLWFHVMDQRLDAWQALACTAAPARGCAHDFEDDGKHPLPVRNRFVGGRLGLFG